jgi:hypothetical protein
MMSTRRKSPRGRRREPPPEPADLFAWAAQLHRAADLVEEYAAGRDMTVREVLAEMPDSPEREELISLLALPPVAARLGVPMGVVEVSPNAAVLLPGRKRDDPKDL